MKYIDGRYARIYREENCPFSQITKKIGFHKVYVFRKLLKLDSVHVLHTTQITNSVGQCLPVMNVHKKSYTEAFSPISYDRLRFYPKRSVSYFSAGANLLILDVSTKDFDVISSNIFHVHAIANYFGSVFGQFHIVILSVPTLMGSFNVISPVSTFLIILPFQ